MGEGADWRACAGGWEGRERSDCELCCAAGGWIAGRDRAGEIGAREPEAAAGGVGEAERSRARQGACELGAGGAQLGTIAELSHPSPGDAYFRDGCRRISGMSQTAVLTEEQMPLGVGSLVSLSINISEPLPALVAGADERTFVLQTASRPACKVGDRAVIGWSIGGELHELRTRVVRGIGVPSELSVARHGIITRTGDRRCAARFVLVAGGSLLVGDREVLGFTHDLSVHGVGLLLDGRDPGARHARRPRGAGRAGRAAAAHRGARGAHE